MISQDELEFMYYQEGSAGSFRTGLYDLYPKGDILNKHKLLNAFPFLQVMEDYLTKTGYWEDLQKRYKMHTTRNDN